MISLVLLFIAALCNALMDTLSHHWYKFRWRHKVTGQWWNPELSWKNKYMQCGLDVRYKWYYKFVWFSDAFHFFKSLMIVLICASIVMWTEAEPLYKLIGFAVCGFVWNLGFGLGYNWIYVKK